MKKIHFLHKFPHRRVISALLALACLLGLLPTASLAAAPGTITLTNCDYNSQTYHSASLGDCHLNQMTFDCGGASRVGFCAEHGKGMGRSLEGQPWSGPQPVTEPTIQSMLAYYYTFTTGTFTDEAKAVGADQVWTAGVARYMNAWVQAVVWRYTSGTMGDPVTACAEELMYVYNSLDGSNYTSIDDIVEGSSFRDRAQYTLEMGAQGMWGSCKVYRYTYAGSSNSYHQASNVQAIMIGELTVTHITHDKYSLTVKKVDATDPSKGLAGAIFQVTSDAGFSQTVTTGGDGTATLTDLDAGTYTVIETAAPEGYEFDATPQYVSLPGGGNTATVTFMDTPEKTGEGTIRKVDADDPTKGLAGAVIKIEGADNDFVGTYTTGEGGYLTDVPWDDLPKGSYTATEVTPPEGYTRSPDANKTRQTFEWDGKTDVALIFENDAKVKVKLIKLDDSGHPLPGAVFNIVKDGQIVGTEATKANGSITVTDVTEGLYAFVEVSAPAPYSCLTEPVFAHVDQAAINGGGTVTVTASDKKLPSLTILKKDEQTGNVIPGTTFEVKAIDGSYHNDVVTGVDGRVTLSNIPAGSYEITEKSVPDPYVVGEYPTQTIYLAPGENRELIFDNMKAPELTISKVEEGTNTPIPGTTFEIKAIDGDYRHDVTTGADGTVTLRVAPGSYRILERSVPEPYCLAENEGDRGQTVSLNAGDTKTLIFKNSKNPLLKIRKIEKGSGTPIPGTVFTLEAINGDYHHEVTTGANGFVELRVAPGSYKVTEKSVPEPYVVGDVPSQTVSLHGGDEKELIFENSKKPLLTIAKIDAETNDVIPKTVFTIQGVNNGYTHEVTTGADGTVSLRVAPGSYRITEKSVPEPYCLAENEGERVQAVSLNAGDTKTLIFKNSKNPLLKIRKIEKGSGTPIPGTVFTLEAINGDYRHEVTTGANGSVELRVAPGSYKITEKSVPEPYVIGNVPTQTVSLHGGDERELIFENLKNPLLTIAKTDAETSEMIPGTVFTIQGVNNGYTHDVTTGADGTVSLRVAAGTYKITEKSVPAPYYLPSLNADRTQTISLNPGDEKTVTFKDHKAPELTIYKEDSVAGAPIEGVKFHVTCTSSGEAADAPSTIDFGYMFTDARGEIKVHEQGKKLYPGEYTITEVAPAPGFQMKEPSTQKVIIHGGESKTVVFQNEPLNAIIIEKYDSVTHAALPGCTFQLRYLGGTSGTGGTVIGQKVTGKTGTAIWTGLKSGAYILEEVDPAEGYSIINSSETVYLAGSGEQSVVTVRFDNSPDGLLLVRKVCSVNPSVTLQDAEFKIMYADGTLIGDGNGIYITDENGEIRIPGLKPGKSVIVTETKAPAGFLIDTQSQTVQIKEGRTVSLTFKNQPKGKLIVQKRDSQTGQPLSGAEFRVTTAAGCEVGLDGVVGTAALTQNGLFTTNENGEIRINNLAPGAYVLTETKAPSGYVMDSPSTNVVIGPNGDTQTIIIKNTKKGNLVVEKYDSVTKQPLSGAQFKITTASGELVADNEGLTSSNGLYTTDRSGQIVLSKLLPDTYVVSEVTAPDGYRQDPTPQTVVVNAGDTQTVRFYDDPLCTLTILKRDAVTQKPLAKAEFTVQDSEGRAIGTNNGRYVTGSDGTVTVTGMQPGATIVVSESKAPTGYIKDDTPKNIVVRTGVLNSLVFEDEPAATLVIQKFIEGTENEPLSGVCFKVTDGSGAAVGPDDGVYFTDHAGEIVLTGLEPGTTVKAREIRTVEGFVLDGTPQDILIKAGEVQRLTFWNKRDCSLTILKQSTSKEPLSGAVFYVTDEDGAAIGTNNGRYTSDRNGLIVIPGLQPGQILVVTEEKAPNGYVRNTTPKIIKIQQGAANSLTFENAKAGSLVINKRSSVDKATPLEGVTFKITTTTGEFLPDEEGKISSNGLYYTDAQGQIVLNSVVGSLVVTEVKSIDGYCIHEANRTKTVEIKPDDTQTIYFYNDPLCSLTITKLDSVTGKPVPNTEFTLKDGNGNVLGSYTTGKDGAVTVTGLVPGTTVVAVETKVPEGYVLDPTPKTITVRNGIGNAITSGGSSGGTSGSGNGLTFENDPTVNLIIHKYIEATKNEPLAGVAFKVTDGSGAAVGTADGVFYTDDAGEIVIEGLEPGTTITAQEIKTVDGFVLDGTPKTVKIKAGKAAELIFWNERAGTLLIEKLDSVTKAPLAGAQFKVLYADGRMVDAEGGKLSSNGIYTTDKNGQIKITDIVGTLVVTEEKAPDGYVIDANAKKQTVVINPNDTQILKFYNEPLCSLTITKLDSVTGKPVPNTEFTLKDGNGNVLGRYTTGKDGAVTVTGLVPGSTVVAVESRVPEGYVLNTMPQTITVRNGIGNAITSGGSSGGTSGSGNGLTFENDPTVNLIIHKYIEGTKNEPLAGVAFKVTDGSGAAIGTADGVFYTDDAGEIVIEGLEPGTTITAREIKTVDGFVLDGTPKTVKIKAGKAAELTFWNQRAGELVIRKLDKQTGKPLAGVQFELTYAEGGCVDNANGHLSSNGLYSTDSHGEIHISGIVGAIVVKETKALPGYTIDPGTQTQTVTVRPQETQTLTYYNIPANTLTIKKYEDGTDNTPLAGVEFLVVDSTGAAVGPNKGYYTTNKNGRIVITGLTPGVTVTVTETKTLEGYVLDGKPQTITIKEGEAQSLTFKNKKAGALVIRKLDAMTKKPLAGVEFQVTYADGSYVDADNGHLSSKGLYTTNQNGEIRISGIVGTVVATEVKTIDGYSINEAARTQTVKINPQDTQLLTFYNAPKQTLTLQKYVDGTTTPIQGVTFLITDSSGQLLGPNNGEYITDRNGRIVLTGLTPGATITAKETKTVEGYVLDTTPQSILIKEGAAQTLTFFNKTQGGLELIKVSESDQTQRIPGVKFEVRKMDGGLVDTVTTDKQGRLYLALPAGNYYAVEIEAAKGFKLDDSKHYFTVKDGKTTTLTVTNTALSSILIHKTDSMTGKGIYGAVFLLYDSGNTPIGQFTSDNNGYVRIEGLPTPGYYYLREVKNDGYVVDTELRTIYVKPGETTEITWQNTPITGQIQIVKTSADYNSMNGWPAGTPIPNTEFEVYNLKTGALVDTIRTDKNGVAATKPLPLGRYKVIESKAADFYSLDQTPIEVEIEYAGQIVKAAMANKSLYTNVSIKKTGYTEVMPGQQIRYSLSGIANNSTTALSSFYWRDVLPVQAVRLDKIVTGTCNVQGNYKIVYKTNLNGEYRTMYDNLSTQQNYVLDASPAALGLASNECVTEFMFSFGVVPANFRQVEASKVYCDVVSWLVGGTQFVNQADVGGVYNGQWITAASRWVTKVYKPSQTLPRTGY